MDEALKIVDAIKSGDIKPLYLLMGEEPYYVDKVSEYIEEHVLSEDERGFNQTILYGRDVNVPDLVGAAKRYPMMAERQVIIVKEAQAITGKLDKLEEYVANCTPTTVLVLCYKGKDVDKRKALYKNFQKHGVVLESKKLKDAQVQTWIAKLLKSKGLQIEPKAVAMINDNLGNNLSRIATEIDKLVVNIPSGSTVTAADVELYVGISKDFNIFELRKAIAQKNTTKAFQIVDYFTKSKNDMPLVVIVAQLHKFFSQLLILHGLKDKSKPAAAQALGVSPYFVDEFFDGIRVYPMKKVSSMIAALRDIDLQSKGVGAANAKESDLFKLLLIKIFA
ncbi:DNA polymerase III subunit delta [Flavobacterium sp.]|uniref:DNA polymerase III subunit delta n=1 Tax=Flavobacterium sp. TaxID=239 RepID=UPI00260D2DC5|nr:DNA polymerase III subunit delta [Flavobacterium sp.]